MPAPAIHLRACRGWIPRRLLEAGAEHCPCPIGHRDLQPADAQDRRERLDADAGLGWLGHVSRDDCLVRWTVPQRFDEGTTVGGKAHQQVAVGGLYHGQHRRIGIMTVQDKQVPSVGRSSMLQSAVLFGLHRPEDGIAPDIMTHILAPTGSRLDPSSLVMLMGVEAQGGTGCRGIRDMQRGPIGSSHPRAAPYR